MIGTPLNTPVVLIIFNRPDTTEQVVAALRAVRPTRMFVIADGPRAHRPDDAPNCAAARAVIDQIDWPCTIVRDYAEANQGCRQRIAGGITRVFETVDRAIILEDDCIPHPTFFRYCTDLLVYWQDDARISMISGAKFQNGLAWNRASYYFSRYGHVTGWATWRRAWAHYDDAMPAWPEMRASGWLTKFFKSSVQATAWTERFDDTYAGRVDSWAYRWIMACWQQQALAIVPKINLVSHIGYGPQATHTQNLDQAAFRPTAPMPFPLTHPRIVERDVRADRRTEEAVFAIPGFWARARRSAGQLARQVGLGWLTRTGRNAKRQRSE